MANSANPEVNKKITVSAIGTLVISVVAFYVGNRYAEALSAYSGMFYEHLGDGAEDLLPLIASSPLSIDMEPMSMLAGLAMMLVVWLVWLRYIAFIGNYRTGEESGSARWGTVKEGKKFRDLTNDDNNLIFTQNFGLALKRPKFDQELDRNLNVLVVGGSGSGKTFNYVTPNICQLNTSYFVTDPKGTLLNDAGFLFTENGYKVKSFNTINLDESMHYNPLKYVKSDTDILSFVNCYIMNTNGDAKAGDPFWENSEKMLYTALIALLRDWFPEKDYNLSSLLTLLSMAEARENDENYESPLDLIFKQIETGYHWVEREGAAPSANAAGNGALSRDFGASASQDNWVYEPTDMVRKDGVKPAETKGLTPDEDFALMNYKNFKVAAGKTLKSIIISCNVRLAPIATAGVRELLKYDEMELDTLGDPGAKVAVFGILSDTDKTLSFLFAIMMWQCIDQLCRKALTDFGGKLPTPVHFIFDEFANIGTIPQIEETIAVTRSRNIGITIILQSMSQLEARYDKKAGIIIDCCDTTLFLGGKSNSTNKEIAEMIGKQTINQMTYNESTGGQSSSASKNLQIQGRDLIDQAEIGKMSRKKAILLIAGTNPLMDDKFDPHKHPRYCYIVDKRNPKRLFDEPFDFKKYMKGGYDPARKALFPKKFFVVDIETTGLNMKEDEIAEIAACKVVDGELADTWHTVVHIEKEMPEEARAINHISDEELAMAPRLDKAMKDFTAFIGEDAVLVGHNIAKFDLPFLRRAALNCGMKLEYAEAVDTLALARKAWPGEKCGMEELRKKLRLDAKGAHRALKDCEDELAVYEAALVALNERDGSGTI